MRKTVLISGGSRGIGRATAVLAAGHGWDVAFTYRADAEAAAQTEAEIAEAGGRSLAIQGDAASEADVLAAFGRDEPGPAQDDV
ncbi:MAG: SDR family NAD(P)-dependent oxidoreductase [Pseudomonadota bacterium]